MIGERLRTDTDMDDHIGTPHHPHVRHVRAIRFCDLFIYRRGLPPAYVASIFTGIRATGCTLDPRIRASQSFAFSFFFFSSFYYLIRKARSWIHRRLFDDRADASGLSGGIDRPESECLISVTLFGPVFDSSRFTPDLSSSRHTLIHPNSSRDRSNEI